MSRLSLCTLLSFLPFAAFGSCQNAAQPQLGDTATWHYPGGQLRETTVGTDRLLELRFTVRTGDNAAPEHTVDLIYGQFYIGDLADFFPEPYPLDRPESFMQFLKRNPKLTRNLNRELHTGGEKARAEAIDQFWKNPSPGSEIPYPFAIYDERIVIREVVDIDHVRAESGKLSTLIVEVPRELRGRNISTTTYWFEADAPCRLVQWGHDMGREDHLEVRQPDQ